MELESLKKYFENNCSPEEARQIQKWIENPDASMDLENDLINVWQNIKVKPGDYTKWSSALEKIHERIEMEEIYKSLNLEKRKKKLEHQAKDRPSKSGYELHKSDRKSKIRYIMPGLIAAVLLVFVVVSFFQFPDKAELSKTVEQIEKSTEPGQKLSFHLADGTKVKLNAGSKLNYSPDFSSNERLVVLEGEAFFEVTKDVTRPFKVITGSVTTTALGTSFNINAFPLNKNIEIALVTGKVSVERTLQSGKSNSLILNPSEMATIIKEDDIFAKSTFDFNQKISWKDGLIYFKDADYHEIVSTLESWYGVKFQTGGIPLKEWKFTGKFENESLNNILIALQFGHNFEYKIKGEEVKLNF